MAELFHTEDTPQMVCWDRKHYNMFEDQLKVLRDSRTVYVGNLSFFTTELQLNETFSTVGPIKRIIMGLNSRTKTPCGFCFIEYFTREHAAACLKYVSGTVCDERVIRCDLDCGFKPGRQYGRGQSGGQIRDERRENYDPARGGPCTMSQVMLQGGLSTKRARDDESNFSINSTPTSKVTPSKLQDESSKTEAVELITTADNAVEIESSEEVSNKRARKHSEEHN